MKDGIVGKAATTGEVQVVHNIREISKYRTLIPDAQSELAVPIQKSTEMLGVLHLLSRRPNVFDEKDIAMMKTLADQIAVALENARLFESEKKARNWPRPRAARRANFSPT